MTRRGFLGRVLAVATAPAAALRPEPVTGVARRFAFDFGSWTTCRGRSYWRVVAHSNDKLDFTDRVAGVGKAVLR